MPAASATPPAPSDAGYHGSVCRPSTGAAAPPRAEPSTGPPLSRITPIQTDLRRRHHAASNRRGFELLVLNLVAALAALPVRRHMLTPVMPACRALPQGRRTGVPEPLPPAPRRRNPRALVERNPRRCICAGATEGDHGSPRSSTSSNAGSDSRSTDAIETVTSRRMSEAVVVSVENDPVGTWTSAIQRYGSIGKTSTRMTTCSGSGVDECSAARPSCRTPAGGRPSGSTEAVRRRLFAPRGPLWCGSSQIVSSQPWTTGMSTRWYPSI